MSGVWLIAFVALWMLVLVEAFFIFAILRQIGMISAQPPAGSVRPSGLPSGTTAPLFVLPDLHGRFVSLADQIGRELLLAFVSPTCRFCKSLLPALNELREQQVQTGVLVQVICQASAEECQQLAAEHDVAATVL